MNLIKRMLTSMVLTLAVSSTLSGFQSEDWIRVGPVGAGFSVMMPAKPEEEVLSGQDLTTHILRLSTSSGFYIVAYGLYAPSLKLNVAGELTANRDLFLRDVGARLIESKKINFEGHEGLEFTGESDQALFRSRLFIFGMRFHQIAVAIFKDRDDAASANRFFESFHFTETKQTMKP